MGKKKKRVLAAAVMLAGILLCVLWVLRPKSSAVTAGAGPKTIRILTIGETSAQALERVSAALSEITLERLGCRVELNMIRPGEYDDRIDDLLLENDFADIFVCRNRTTLNKLLDGNYIYRLDRYLSRYPEFRQAVPDESAWALTGADGYTYGIPFGNGGAYHWGFIMRQDICEALEIDPAAVTTLHELHQILLQVRESYPDLVPVASDRGRMDVFASPDLLVNGGGGLVSGEAVVSITQMPEFLRRCGLMELWYREGLILRDAPMNKESAGVWMASGLAFGSFAQLDRYTVRELAYALDIPLECAVLDGAFYGESGTDMSFTIYAYTENVDLCLQLLRLIYTDPEILRMCVYGQEGIDYILSGAGAVVPAPETARADRYINWCWALRDSVPPPVAETDPDWYASAATGGEGDAFFFDNRKVSGEIYQCSEVLEKYFGALCAGMIDAEEGIAMMEEELALANISAVKRELERQRESWPRTN